MGGDIAQPLHPHSSPQQQSPPPPPCRAPRWPERCTGQPSRFAYTGVMADERCPPSPLLLRFGKRETRANEKLVRFAFPSSFLCRTFSLPSPLPLGAERWVAFCGVSTQELGPTTSGRPPSSFLRAELLSLLGFTNPETGVHTVSHKKDSSCRPLFPGATGLSPLWIGVSIS